MGSSAGWIAWAIISAVLALAGLIAAVIGLRGRSIGNTPHCARCGFDLTGIYSPASDAPRLCPECGTDTAKPGAAKIGVRKRRMVLIIVGLILTLGAGSACISTTYPGLQRTNFVAMQPTWLLMAQADGGIASARPTILAELLARESAGKLPDADLRTLVARALIAQANLSRAWDTQWGDFVVAAHKRGLTTDQQCQQFMDGAVTLEVRVRPSVRAGQLTSLSWATVEARAPSRKWSRGDSVLIRHFRPSATVSRNGQQLDEFAPDNMADPEQGPFGRECGGFSSQYHAWDLSPDFYDVVLEGRAAVGFRHMTFRDEGWQVTTKRTQSLILTPRDQPSAKAIPSAVMAAEIARDITLQVHASMEDRWDEKCRQMVPTPRINIEVGRQGTSNPLAFICIVRDHDHPSRRWTYDDANLEPGISGTAFSISNAEGYAFQRVDVILRTSLDAAERSSVIQEVWDGEVIFENIEPARGQSMWSTEYPKLHPTRVTSPPPPLSP